MSQENKDFSSVADFYTGKSIFITGCTGFLGKVLLEKLLYSCSGVENVYILTRSKRALTPEQRVQTITDAALFERLKEKRPEDLKKIVPINGDLGAPNLGISDEDEKVLLEKVSIVFHSAATVKFNEPLKLALDINLEGTRRVLDLCKRMNNIQALVHVSTVYSNTDRDVVDEVVYPPPADITQVYQYVEQFGDSDEHISSILNGRPNTYTFTKALAESLIVEQRGNVPTIIIRPSIVTPSKNEPVPGWLDSWQGLTGLLASGAKGLNRLQLGDGSNIAALVPVDYVSNMAIVAAAKCHRNNDVTVYNCCTSSANPITWNDTVKYFIGEGVKHGINDMPFPMIYFLKSRFLLALLSFFIEIIPAYLGDFWLIINRQQPRYVKTLTRIINLREMICFVPTRNSTHLSRGAEALVASLTHRDRLLFPCDITDIDWPKYMALYYTGVSRYLLKKGK